MRIGLFLVPLGIAVVLTVAAITLSMRVSSAEAHVHGITPLLQLDCILDNTVTGANQTNNTPASSVNEGPITGLIPRDVGSAPLTGGDGGFDAPVPVCSP